MAPHVRDAAPEDRESILELMVSVIHASLDAEHWNDVIRNVTSNLTIWSERPDQCVHLVAELEGRIVAVVLVKEFWNLCSLFVAPRYQGQGVGRRLVEHAIAACRAQSHEQAIFLNAAPNAVNFYLAIGFQVREATQTLPPGFQAMRYQLAAGAA